MFLLAKVEETPRLPKDVYSQKRSCSSLENHAKGSLSTYDNGSCKSIPLLVYQHICFRLLMLLGSF